jgi:hypothetical protein
MRHYLLEKARVAAQPTGEFNFHIFHMFLDGLDDGAAAALCLERDPGAYAYLNDGVCGRYKGSGGKPVALKPGSAPRPFTSAHGARKFSVQAQQMMEAGFSTEDLDGLYVYVLPPTVFIFPTVLNAGTYSHALPLAV